MEFLAQFFDVVLHLDKYLPPLIQQYGVWVYAILFLVIFSETGFVVLPFLPGDSLLFVAGLVWVQAGMDIPLLMAVLSLAAILGNSVNYAVGRYLGNKVYQWPDSRFFKRSTLDKTHAFYERHGGKTIIASRFLPLFRTFAPFVAGVGAMPFARFTLFNVTGGVLWVLSLTLAGVLFGNIPVIRNNLSLMVIGIVVVSLLPAVIGWWQHRRAAA
ncbi:MAG: DedA family protein [Rhodocyclaceae bacterium]|nr:MAG: DedA family protein [Rhodocyclaceae bacterium]